MRKSAVVRYSAAPKRLSANSCGRNNSSGLTASLSKETDKDRSTHKQSHGTGLRHYRDLPRHPADIASAGIETVKQAKITKRPLLREHVVERESTRLQA